MTPNTWTAPVEETRIRNRDVAFNPKLLGLRGVLWLGFKEALGPLFAVAIVGPAGFGMGGGVFWPRLTTRLVEFTGRCHQ